MNYGFTMMSAMGRGPRLWTPADLGEPPSVWLDASSGVTIDSGRVLEWRDRSGNNWHATQPVSSRRPEQLSSPWRISYGSDDYLSLHSGSYELYRNVSSAWVLCVFRRPLDSGNVERPLVYFTTPSFATRVAMTAGGVQSGQSNRIQFGGRRLDSDAFDYVSHPHSGEWTLALGITDYAARSIELWVDGDLKSSKSNAFTGPGPTSNTAGAWSVVAANGGNPPAQHLVGEQSMVVGGVSLPSPTEIDELFGWAAWQCGLQDNLPVGHPYKTEPPMIEPGPTPGPKLESLWLGAQW